MTNPLINEQLLNSISQGVLVSDAEGQIRYINDAFTRITGWTRDEVLSQPCDFLDGPGTDPAAVQKIQHCLQEGTPYYGEIYHYRKGGLPFWDELYITPVLDDSQQVIQFISLHNDVTRRRQTTQTLSRRIRYESIIARMSNRLLVHRGGDPLSESLEYLLEASESDRVYIFLNFYHPEHGMCTRYAYEACAPGVTPELHNPDLQCVPFHVGFQRWAQELGAGRIISGAIQDFPASEQALLVPQGIQSILVIPLYSQGSWIGFIGLDDIQHERSWDTNDIRLLRTGAEVIGAYMEHREFQQELQKINEELEQRVQVEVQRRQASERALIGQSRIASMGEMVTAIAHHWRQPLNMIALQVQALHDLWHNPEARSDEEVGEITQRVMERVSDLSQTLENLQGFCRKNEPLQTRDLLNEVNAAINLFQTQFTDLDITIDLPDHYQKSATSPMAPIYPAAFRQALFNIFTNARDAIQMWRHEHQTNQPGLIKVKSWQDKQHACLSISDNGGGANADLEERLFEPFFTTKDIGRGDGVISGTGLGLYTVKQLIEGQMFGTVQLLNQPGKGLEVLLELPLSVQNPPAALQDQPQ
ncbi:PAS domain-containing sensor histidine kinase [Desulfurispira natronophila]|uniref:histidine kinase n=1 Tax=Desulfurispira natronophila TaxID=682562 RepID=A0A7W7Y339_9BACT|nr:HAMP domain-containing sensor histidine kinase [Desulfurispira natronophila]MBB5021172.1 PAS domain S-box-containing protein [Desulfurispira natronophila]